MNKKILNTIKQPLIVLIVFFSILTCVAFILYQKEKINYLNNKLAIKPEIVYLEINDTTKINAIKLENDSLKMELFIAKYKLARIKEYVKLSENGSNYRYLGGWINRVIENHDTF